MDHVSLGYRQLVAHRPGDHWWAAPEQQAAALEPTPDDRDQPAGEAPE